MELQQGLVGLELIPVLKPGKSVKSLKKMDLRSLRRAGGLTCSNDYASYEFGDAAEAADKAALGDAPWAAWGACEWHFDALEAMGRSLDLGEGHQGPGTGARPCTIDFPSLRTVHGNLKIGHKTDMHLTSTAPMLPHAPP